jgi:hypothetical protein
VEAKGSRKRRLGAAVVLAGLGSISAWSFGCAGFPARIRSVTYTPEFGYITEDQIRSTMGQLGQQVNRLATILRREAPVTEAERAEILGLLEAMEHTTTALATRQEYTNHPLIDRHLDPFRRDIAMARRAVASEPPNYFLVGSLTGACLYCHGTEP